MKTPITNRDQLSALLQLLTESGSLAETTDQMMAKYLIDMAIIEIAQQIPRLESQYDHYCNLIFEAHDELPKN